MQLVSRIEMIVAFKEVDKIIKVLEDVGIPGYTIIRNVIGKSDLGTVSDDLSSDLSNVFIICYSPQEKVELVVEKIKPVINKYGGVCYLSDAKEIRSFHCIASL